MAEQTFKSPGFFNTETVKERDQNLEQAITTVPAGIVGFSEKGPAFVPTTVHSYESFVEIFGEARPEYPSTLAVKKYLENRDALTFVRVLGAGANTISSHFLDTETFGTVQNGGFILTSSGDQDDSGKNAFGEVQFICAEHDIATEEANGYPVFASNNTTLSSDAFLVRGMLMTTSGSKFTLVDYNGSFDPASNNDFSGCTFGRDTTDEMYGKFKLILTSSDNSLGTVDGFKGAKVFSASLNPSDDAYIAKVLNTDPSRFQDDKHLLYAHFPVENEIASIPTNSSNITDGNDIGIGLLSGSAGMSAVSGKAFSEMFGNFKSRYQAPRTTSFISQPFGNVEYDLFHFECIDDGSHANNLFKVSITNIRKPKDFEDPYPTFNVELRVKRDLDTSPQVIESYVGCNLNPNSENFIASKIGDMKLVYNFDTTDPAERRLLVKGTYPNVSSRIRVVLSNSIINEDAPKEAAPFGFRGLPLIKTFGEEPNRENLDLGLLNGDSRFVKINTSAGQKDVLSGSILPPVPFRFKLTMGEALSSPGYTGHGSIKESAIKDLRWGIQFERIPREGEISNPVKRPNESIIYNDLLDNYSKFLGISGLDTLLTGSGADDFHSNKFTLSRVALGKHILTPDPQTVSGYTALLTGSARDLMRDSAYIRNASLNAGDYTFRDTSYSGTKTRLTLASLYALTSSVYFNRLSEYAGFTNMFYGGFDGLNILDSDMAVMNDRASSADDGGKGKNSPDIGLTMNFGSGESNSIVNSYKEAVNLLTDPAQSRINVLCIPGIRSDELLSHAIERVEEYSKAILLMDVAHVDKNSIRIYEDSKNLTHVRNTVEDFVSKNYDSSYAAAYFPDIVMEDNGKRFQAPASIAALAAIGYNDNTSFPWFAPAGFNRGALGFVNSTRARLNKEERDIVYEGRINPIASFPKSGHVIFGQKTLQRARTSLDRVNVRRMLLEVKRVVSDVSIGFIFEANTPEVRSSFKKRIDDQLLSVQENQGIDQFKVIMDSTNNTQADIDNNVLNGRIVLVPTRTIEFISIDFVISNSGVDFI